MNKQTAVRLSTAAQQQLDWLRTEWGEPNQTAAMKRALSESYAVRIARQTLTDDEFVAFVVKYYEIAGDGKDGE